VLGANVLAVCAMGWYVWATHPLLRRRLHEEVQVHVWRHPLSVLRRRRRRRRI